MAATTEATQAPIEQFIDECVREYQRVESEAKEIELLLQQSSSELERLVQRNAQATNRMRQVEAALDTLPRADIREAYTSVLETQQRLFTMRGQVEKLQSDHNHLQRYLDLLRKMNQLVSYQGPEAPAPDKGEAVQPLAVRIIEAQERERQRLSRQMHDGPAQALTNLILQAEICERLFAADPEQGRAELANLKNAVAATFHKVRGFILSLRPMMLDDLGLVPTLRRYVDSFAENSGMQVRLVFTGKERRLASHKEVTVFRLLQDLLNNAQEIGHATSAQIHLDLGDDLARVVFEDNGNGYPADVPTPEAERLGLAMVRERVDMLGGQIAFDLLDGQGLRVDLELPC